MNHVFRLLLFFLTACFLTEFSYGQTAIDSISINYNSKLDSIVTLNSDGNLIRKFESYLFSKDNKLISCVEKASEREVKYEYEYDDCGNQILYKVFRSNSGEWELQYQEERIFQNNLNCTQSLLNYHSSKGNPPYDIVQYLDKKTYYQYISDGRIQEIQQIDDYTNNVTKTNYEYNGSQNIQSVIYYALVENTLQKSGKLVYAYSEGGNNTNFQSEHIFRFDTNGDEKLCMKTENDFSDLVNNQIQKTTIAFFDENGETCLNRDVRTLHFASDLKSLKKTVVQRYNKAGVLYASLTYNDKGEIIEGSENLGPARSNITTKGSWTHNKEEGIDIFTFSQWEESLKTDLWTMTVHYEKSPTGVTTILDDPSRPVFSFSPNPVNDYLFITCKPSIESYDVNFKYSIYDTSGRLHLQGTAFCGGDPIAVYSLRTGTYLLAYSTGKFNGTFVFIKKD